MNLSWQKAGELQTCAKAFDAECARYPTKKIIPSKSHFTDLVTGLRDDLQAQDVVAKMEFQGSSYEGIKVPSSPPEYDVCFFLEGGDILYQMTPTNKKGKPKSSNGYTKLQLQRGFPRGNSPIWMSLRACRQNLAGSKNRLLLTNLVRERFYARVQSALSHLTNIALSMSSTAVLLTVYDPNNNKKVWYTADLVPGFELKDGTSYICKGSSKGDKCTWFENNAIYEKRILKTIDVGNQCHRKCIRMVKVIRDIDPELNNMRSYLIKNAVLLLQNEFPAEIWSEDELGLRFVQVLQKLYLHISQGHMPQHDNSYVNLVKNDEKHQDIARRLKELITNKDQLMKLMNKRVPLKM